MFLAVIAEINTPGDVIDTFNLRVDCRSPVHVFFIVCIDPAETIDY